MAELALRIEGLGWWSTASGSWSAARAALVEGRLPAGPPVPLPAALLAPGERRRAPELVRIACEVAAQAVADAGRDAATLASVFASAHGDMATTDALCASLADDPPQVSPTRFHNSVHNAAAGYWTAATGCHAPSTALCARQGSLAAGLLQAAVQAVSEQLPVLLVASEVAAAGPLGRAVAATPPFGFACVLAPAGTDAHTAGPRLAIRHMAGAAPAPLPGDAFAAAVPLLQALARGRAARVVLAHSPHHHIQVAVQPWA